MKRLFLCHHSAFLDPVRAFALELSLRGIAPWVAPDGGFMIGDDQETVARRVIRHESYGLLLYATPDVLTRDFIRRVEMREAIRRRQTDHLLAWLMRRDRFVLATVLDGISIDELRHESRRYLRHDLTRYAGIKLNGDSAAAARAVLHERVRHLAAQMPSITLQFSTREPLPDEPTDILRIEGATSLRHVGDTDGWNRISSGLIDVKAALAQCGRPTLHVHGSRHLTGSFLLGNAFRRSTGFPLVVRARDGWWPANGPVARLDARVTSTNAASSTLAVRITATDKQVAAASDAYLAARDVRASFVDVTVAPPTGAADARAIAALVRRAVADIVGTTRAQHILLFAAVPQGLAALLGFEWNALPPTQLHEFDGSTYVPSVLVRS